MTDEIYRGYANRDLLLARNKRRQQNAAADQTASVAAARRAPSTEGNPFGRRHAGSPRRPASYRTTRSP